MSSLVGLTFTDGMFGKQILNSLEPIKSLHNLEYLNISNLRANSGDLTPLTYLKNLKYLDIPIYYEMAEYAKVFAALPNCDHGISAYRKTGEQCRKCTNGELVFPMAKGRRKICLECQKDKVENLTDEFSMLVSEYS